MFSSHWRKVLSLLGTREVELAILVLLVIDTFGLCFVTPLSSIKVSGAGKHFRDTILGSYPQKATDLFFLSRWTSRILLLN